MEHELEHVENFDSRMFMIAVKRLADSLSYGTDRSPYLGSGVEYVQSRQYQWGDPIRSIDWRVTARTRKPYVKEYESPKRLPCYLLLDTSASMTISSHKHSKYRQALFVAGGIAFACLDRVSPVGVLGVGDREMHVRPTLSRHQAMQWMMGLRRFRYDERTTLAQRISELSRSLLNRALVVVLSDMHEPESLPQLKRMSQQHDCVVLQFVDPAEDNLRGAGLFRGQEAETGRHFVGHGRKQWTDRSDTTAQLRRAGIDHLVLHSNEPMENKLRHFFESRGILGRGAR